MSVNIVCTHDAKTISGQPAMIDVVDSDKDRVILRFMFRGEDGQPVIHQFVLDASDTMNLGLGLIKEAWSVKP